MSLDPPGGAPRGAGEGAHVFVRVRLGDARDGSTRAAHDRDPVRLQSHRCQREHGRAGEPVDARAGGGSRRHWASFAHSGNPNHKGLPHWPAYTAETRGTMIFDIPCRVENDPTKEVRQILKQQKRLKIV